MGRILALIDIEYRFFSRFEVDSITHTEDGYSLDGTIWGEEINLEKHVTRTEVKAMTYAEMKIETEHSLTRIWFTLDL